MISALRYIDKIQLRFDFILPQYICSNSFKNCSYIQSLFISYYGSSKIGNCDPAKKRNPD